MVFVTYTYYTVGHKGGTELNWPACIFVTFYWSLCLLYGVWHIFNLIPKKPKNTVFIISSVYFLFFHASVLFWVYRNLLFKCINIRKIQYILILFSMFRIKWKYKWYSGTRHDNPCLLTFLYTGSWGRKAMSVRQSGTVRPIQGASAKRKEKVKTIWFFPPQKPPTGCQHSSRWPHSHGHAGWTSEKEHIKLGEGWW